MRGVITMNEEYETRFLCNSSKVRGPGPYGGAGAGAPPASPTTWGLRAGGGCGRGAADDSAPETGVPGFFAFSG